jgi:hypothetical protein
MDLTFLGPSAAVVIVVLAFLKFMQKEGDLNRKAQADDTAKKQIFYDKLTKASDGTTQAVRENSRLIKNLNGKLQKAIIDKHEENHPEPVDKA